MNKQWQITIGLAVLWLIALIFCTPSTALWFVIIVAASMEWSSLTAKVGSLVGSQNPPPPKKIHFVSDSLGMSRYETKLKAKAILR